MLMPYSSISPWNVVEKAIYAPVLYIELLLSVFYGRAQTYDPKLRFKTEKSWIMTEVKIFKRGLKLLFWKS